MPALLVGYGFGFMVALQVGPISLLAIRSTLRAGVTVGLAIGAAVAIVDTSYAAAGAAGAAGLLSIDPLRVAFGCIGAAVLALLGARTLWSALRVRDGGEATSSGPSPPARTRNALHSVRRPMTPSTTAPAIPNATRSGSIDSSPAAPAAPAAA